MAKVLNVMLVRVEPNSVLLEWNCFPPTVRQQLVTCQARYGLLTPEKITQVLGTRFVYCPCSIVNATQLSVQF